MQNIKKRAHVFGRMYGFFGLGHILAWFFCFPIEAEIFSRFFEFDLAGHLKKVTTADNSWIDYEYNQLQQLVKVTDSQGKIFRYQYDVNGNCTRAEDENGLVDYEYDLLNRLISVAYPGIIPIRYSYDFRGRLQQIIYPGGIRVSYSYDAADRLLSVNYPHGTTQYVYDQVNNTLSKMILPSGITTEYGYDKAKRVISVFHRRFDKTLIMGFQYVFDGNGNRIRTEEISENGSRIVDFSYDKLNRLINAKYPEGYEKYTYDNLGNRLSKETTSALIKYEYDKNNRLIKTDDTQFFYDARGHLIKKVTPNKVAQYTYDIHDNLIAYQDEKYDVRYTYDSEGRRTSKSINGEKIFYINDARSSVTQVLIEVGKEKGTKIFYIYGLSRLNQMSSKGSHSYLYDYPDRNIIALVDGRECLCNRYDYEAFGLLKNSHSTIPNNFTYAGEVYEEETGLIFLRNRYYDPEMGRFISADPSLGELTNPQSFNPYAYAGNNPVNFIDPLGLRSARFCVYPAGTVTKCGKSLTGHGFWILTKDNGEVITIGRYPIRPQYDDEMTSNTFFHEFPATDKQINAIVNVTEKGPYLGVAGNCIDGLERGLEVLGIEHPSFSFMGISVPTKAIIWLESLAGKDDFKRALEQDLKFAADPDIFCPAIRFAPAVVKPSSPCSAISSGDLGGVSFDKTAQLIGTLTDVVGATYDFSTGQLILIGSQNYSLPPMDFDDLAVAVRSVYGLGGKPPQDPGVSIDWNMDNNKKIKKNRYKDLHPMPVRYEGATEGTRFGQVMFEADRLLKCLGGGKDNITGNFLKPNVPGFASLSNRYADPHFKMEPNLFNRMWFVPREVILAKSPDGKSIVFDRIEMEVLTESKRKNKQKGNTAVEGFARHFTDHFEEFSKQYPILAELKHLGKITAIVKWMKENNVPLDLSLFSNYIPKSAFTPFTTPTTYFPYARGMQIGCLTGGVIYHLSESNFHEVFSEMPSLLQESAINSRPSENEMEWDMDGSFGDGLKAIAHTVERTLKIGNIRKTFVDMSFYLPGEFSLDLIRYYNSFNERISGFGKGWELNVSLLSFPRKRAYVNWGEKNIVKEIFPEIFVSEKGREVRYLFQGLDMQSLPVYQTEGLTAVLTEQENGNFILRKEDIKMFFDRNGKLIRKVDKQGQSIEYAYDNGQLMAINHQNGKKIQLEYHNERIIRIIGPGEKIIYYQYDENGQLYSVTDQVGPIIFYGYDSEKNLNAIYDAKKRIVFEAVYDNYHRAITVTDGKAELNRQFSLKDHVAQIQGPNQMEIFNQYDSNYRLLKTGDSLGRSIEIFHQNDVLPSTIIKDGFGGEAKYSYDSRGNLCSIKNKAGVEERFWYDALNRLTAAMDGRKRVKIYLYDKKGRLKYFFPSGILTSEDSTTNQASFHYETMEAVEYELDDRTGAVTTIKKGGELAKLFVYDAEGRIVEVSDPYGYKIQRKYDKRSRLTSIGDIEGGFEYVYNERDQVTKISSPVGNVRYEYDEVGNLIGTKDANGNKTHLEYDENYNLVKVIDAEGGVTYYEYNDFHGLARIILPNGSSKKIIYDSLNRPTQEIIGE